MIASCVWLRDNINGNSGREMKLTDPLVVKHSVSLSHSHPSPDLLQKLGCHCGSEWNYGPTEGRTDRPPMERFEQNPAILDASEPLA